MGILTDSFRTGTVSDFSIVTKAVFYILPDDPTATTATVIKKLPVQFNPSDIKDTSAGRFSQILGPNKSGKSISEFKAPNADVISIYLEYNIYEEYNMRTAGGALTGMGSGDFSLTNETMTSMQLLKQYSGKPLFSVLFKWGPNEIYGKLENVVLEYKTFSVWGEPLIGTASLDIRRKILGTNSEGIEKSPMGELGKLITGEIKAYTVAQNALTTAALTASAALR